MKLPFSAAVALSLAFAAPGQAATIVGNSLADRGTLDAYSGQIFLLNANLNSLAGQQVTGWSFFNNNNAISVTPVLVQDTSGTLSSFTIRGIGATIAGIGSGAQSGAFNLVSGSGVIGTNYYLGYYDGSWNPGTGSATPNTGSVEWNMTDDPAVPGQIDSLGTIWLHNASDGSNTPALMGVGAVNPREITFPVVDQRHHSINFTIDPVPEPAALLPFGAAGLLLLRRRR
jgi:hypothetical protein